MINRVVEEIKKLGLEAEVATSRKVNGDRTGIRLGTGNICPCFYMEEGDTRTAKEIAADVVEMYRNSEIPSVDIKNLKNISETVFPCLISQKGNEELLSSIPHKKFSDLAIVYRTRPITDGTMLVTNELLAAAGISEEELFGVAKANMPKHYCKSMEEMLLGLAPEMVELEDFDFGACPMFVLTTEDNQYGANVMLNTEELDLIANKLGGKIWILPSSVHEIIVIPCQNRDEFFRLSEMISEINNTVVVREDVLSNHPYLYKYGEGFVN